MNVIKRNAVFVYPDLNLLSRDDMLITNRLITNMYTIVSMVNKQIVDILYCGEFSRVKCLPTAKLTMEQAISDSKLALDNIRICIVKYKDINYAENYTNIVNNYKNGNCDISHLVALHILADDDNKITFEQDQTGGFDVIIKCNRKNLKNILVSIMLDISLYHYFLLSGKIEERKKFNIKKIEYIFENNNPEELTEIYGNYFGEIDKYPKYLPYSLKYVRKCKQNGQVNQEIIRQAICDYDAFIVKNLSTNVVINRNGSVKGIEQYDDRCLIDTVQKLTKNDPASCIIIICLQDSAKKDIVDVLKYKKEKQSNTWIHKLYSLSETVQSYQIFNVKLEEN